MNWINLYTSFEGRITRKPFWIGILSLAALELAVSLATYQYEADKITNVADLILTYPEFAVAAKRAHDRDISTWIIGLFFAGSVAFDLLAIAGLAGTTEAGASVVVPIALWGIFGLVVLVDLGFRRGTEGPNRHGPDPLAKNPP